MEKAIREADFVSLVIPKSLLNAPEHEELREIICNYKICSIIDFSENGFNGVKIETINILIDTSKTPGKVDVYSLPLHISMEQEQDYIINDRNYISELTQFNADYDDRANATQLHHIFPKGECPEIMHYLENLIALTPNQHYGFAYPNNNTYIVDLTAKNTLLVAKTNSIEYNLNNEEPIYEFSNLLHVLSVGFDDNTALEIANNDFIGVMHFINCHYDSIVV